MEVREREGGRDDEREREGRERESNKPSLGLDSDFESLNEFR